MKELKSAKPRTLADAADLRENVRAIIEEIRTEGDDALIRYNEKFDGCRRRDLRITREEIKEAYESAGSEMISNIRAAAANIRAFASEQIKSLRAVDGFEPMEGVYLGHRIIPVEACCCYVPGGSYPLYSTALMLGIPAKTAGVKRIIACSPAMKGTDRIDPRTLAAMDIAGIDEIYVLGGAQAVAAVSYGTAQIAPVDMMVGPGNSYVTEAKRQCFGQVGIDFLAGPSEVLIIADRTADPAIIAADILAQSEHDKVAKGIAVVTDESLGNEVIRAVESQLKELDIADIAACSWQDYGEVLLAEDLAEAAEYANGYAPEHLEVCIAEDKENIILDRLHNYGSLFIGQNTAEVFGDYASGTNHTLPTLGAARYTGGVWTGTFLKVCTHQKMTAAASENIAPLVSAMAEGEGLTAHAKAAQIRMKKD